jgi:aryl sulfotransferase
MRRYAGVMSDNERWERFRPRPEDTVISTPSKCGTTWMQHIVAMLVLDTTTLGAPIGTLSPWLDARTHTESHVFDLLEAQGHRRTIKTHTPMDGLPVSSDLSFIAMARHPLDVALSFVDHFENADQARVVDLITQASGIPDLPPRERAPEDPGEYLAWWIENDSEPNGAGPSGLGDFCNSIRASWEARNQSNVLLVHYADLLSDPLSEIARIAGFLELAPSTDFIADVAAATSFAAMKSDAQNSPPYAHDSLWSDPQSFFQVGGTRPWADLISDAVLERFEERLQTLGPDQRAWVLTGS